MTNLQAWLHAFRLRTLPLAFSSIITGGSIAFHRADSFDWLVFALCLSTTLLLQVLSNLANDYGDSEKGTDNDDRIGPKRAVQSGAISFAQIKRGIFSAVVLSLVSGIWLILAATRGMHIGNSLFFILLGVAAIAAAIKYTIGRNAYGYVGLGDVFVLLFFGLVGVCGSYFLLSHSCDADVLLPAVSIGCFAAAVLNLNNMRDRMSDSKAGKNTLAVKLGRERTKLYHCALLITGWLCAVTFTCLNSFSLLQWLMILPLPFFVSIQHRIWRISEPRLFDPLLKQTALLTFAFSVLFAVAYFFK